jgi:hypothetical protein
MLDSTGMSFAMVSSLLWRLDRRSGCEEVQLEA